MYKIDNRPKKHRGRYTLLGISLGIGLTIFGFFIYNTWQEPIEKDVTKVSNLITTNLTKIVNIPQSTLYKQQPIQIEKQNVSINPIDLENQIHLQINYIRQQAGLKPLIYDIQLSTIARNHSQDMGINNYFDHTSPAGKTLLDRYRDAQYPCAISGENIQSNSLSEINTITETWMNSEGHKDNILSPMFTSEGIGVYISGDDVLITEDFC